MGLGGGILGGIIGGIIGGPWGAGIGAGIGLFLTGNSQKSDSGKSDKEAERAQLFLFSLFRCYGKLAKSDGLVSREEADFVQSVLRELDLPSEFKQYLIKSFNEGKNDNHSFAELVKQLASYTAGNQYEDIMHGFCVLMIADGQITENEKRNLIAAENVLGLPGYTNAFIRQCSRNTERPATTPSLDAAYKTLGVASNASDSEVRSAWRKKIMEFHPDKIQGKGLSDEFIRFAEEQTRRVNEAYEQITASRKNK